MAQTQMSISLPTEIAELVRKKISTGEYANESDMIRDSLQKLFYSDVALENWLQDEAGPAYDALRAHPERALTVAEVRQALASEHAETLPRG